MEGLLLKRGRESTVNARYGGIKRVQRERGSPIQGACGPLPACGAFLATIVATLLLGISRLWLV